MSFNFNNNPNDIIKAYNKGLIKKILVIRVSRMGDLLFTTPALRCLKTRFQKSEIHYLTNNYSKSLLKNNPNVKQVHLLERISFSWKAFQKAPVIKILAKEHFDLVIPFRWREEYRSLLTAINAPFVYTPTESNGSDKHFAEMLLEGFSTLGVKDDGIGMDLFFDDNDKKSAASFLDSNGISNAPLIIFHSGCYQLPKFFKLSYSTKRLWPVTHWIELALKVIEYFETFPVLTEFSPFDAKYNKAIMKRSGLILPVFNTSKTGCFAALLNRSDYFITIDSGPLHIASAVNAPTVAIFGPTTPSLTGPYKNRRGTKVLQADLPCVPCKGKRIKCTKNLCMHKITPDEVFVAIKKLDTKQREADITKTAVK